MKTLTASPEPPPREEHLKLLEALWKLEDWGKTHVIKLEQEIYPLRPLQ